MPETTCQVTGEHLFRGLSVPPMPQMDGTYRVVGFLFCERCGFRIQVNLNENKTSDEAKT